jgi:pimeloyl-ACP methyl ester carboxylesterase
VLAVVGEHELPYIVERSRQLADLVADGEFIVLPDTAHVPQLDAPETLNAVLREFLDRVHRAH